MTKEEIQKHAQELKENFGDAPLFVGGWIEGATWANDRNAALIAELKGQIKDLQFIKEGDALLLQAANQQIQKERDKIEILQGAYDTAKSHAAELEKYRDLHLRTIAALQKDKAELLAVFIKHQERFVYADSIESEVELCGDDLKEIVLLLQKHNG